MTQHNKKIISLKKVIRNTLGKGKSEKYLKGTEIIFSNTLTSNSMDIYQYALSQLLDGDTEKALNCVIFALDFDRENKLALHLCKTMLFSLTQYLSENNIEQFKQKYSSNLESVAAKSRKRVKELEKTVNNEELELEKLQKGMMKHRTNPIFFFFKKGKLKKEVQGLKTKLSNYNSELDQAKSELNKLEEFLLKEEFIKVVGLIIEVCVFPSRFAPDLTKTNYM